MDYSWWYLTDYSDQDSFVIALVAPYFSTKFTVMNSKTLLSQYICIADSWHETMEYSTDNDRPCQFTRLIKLSWISGWHLTAITHAKPHNGFRVLTGVQCSVQTPQWSCHSFSFRFFFVSFRLFNIKTYVKNTIGKTVQSISSLCWKGIIGRICDTNNNTVM